MGSELFWKEMNEMLQNDKWQHIDYYILQSYLRQNEKIVVLDVSGDNTKSFFTHQNIYYLSIPYNEILNNIYDLEEYKTQLIVCVCEGGPKSAVVAQLLRFKGFNATFLAKGTNEVANILGR